MPQAVRSPSSLLPGGNGEGDQRAEHRERRKAPRLRETHESETKKHKAIKTMKPALIFSQLLSRLSLTTHTLKTNKV